MSPSTGGGGAYLHPLSPSTKSKCPSPPPTPKLERALWSMQWAPPPQSPKVEGDTLWSMQISPFPTSTQSWETVGGQTWFTCIMHKSPLQMCVCVWVWVCVCVCVTFTAMSLHKNKNKKSKCVLNIPLWILGTFQIVFLLFCLLPYQSKVHCTNIRFHPFLPDRGSSSSKWGTEIAKIEYVICTFFHRNLVGKVNKIIRSVCIHGKPLYY